MLKEKYYIKKMISKFSIDDFNNELSQYARDWIMVIIEDNDDFKYTIKDDKLYNQYENIITINPDYIIYKYNEAFSYVKDNYISYQVYDKWKGGYQIEMRDDISAHQLFYMMSELKNRGYEYQINNNDSFKDVWFEYFINVILSKSIDYLDEKQDEELDEKEDEYQIALEKIQKAFRKYRYNPEYKFCKFTQINNLRKDNILSEIEFSEYLKKEEIKIFN